MNNKIALGTPMLKRLIAALSGVDNGKILLDLGRLSTASLTVDQLDIGQDIVELPLIFHLGGNVDGRGIRVTLKLSNWQVRDEAIWFRINTASRLHEKILKITRAPLINLLDGIIQRYCGDQAHLLQNDNRLGIPISILLSRWEDFILPVEITGIEVNNGLAIYFG